MTAFNAFHGSKTFSGELLTNGEIVTLDFIFEPNGIIRGTVLAEDGVTRVEGARVDLRHPGLSASIFTDAEGRFEFPLVPPEDLPFPIDAFYEDGVAFRNARILVCFTRFGQVLEVEIVLPKQGSISGIVEDSFGEPVALADVALTETEYPRRQLTHSRPTTRDGSRSPTSSKARSTCARGRSRSAAGVPPPAP